MDLSHITTDDMVEDYYASLMDLETCKRLLPSAEIALHGAEQDGVALEHAKHTTMRLRQRVRGNERIIRIIKGELEKRGELARIS
jgi:hypothetical protein